MSIPKSNLRGILLAVAATLAFTTNDTFLKIATAELPPFQSLFLRGVASLIWAVPLLWITGSLGKARLMFDRRVQARNAFELVAVYGFVLALAYAPIADVAALSQLSPMVMLVGAAFFFGERIGMAQVGLILMGFAGAVMVAQPGGSGFSAFALFGLWNAVASATRDLVGRRIGAEVPGMVVAAGSGLIVTIGAGVAMLVFERWVMPSPQALGLIAASALFLMLGHFLIFSAYRTALVVGAVLPFLYSSTIWALISGVVVFGTLPNVLAMCGIVLIVTSGIAVVVLERVKRRVLVTA